MPGILFSDKEETGATLGGCDYGSRYRIMARSPTRLLFNALGCHIWERGEGHHRSVETLFRERPTKAGYERAQARIDEVFGVGVGAAVLEAWSRHKTVIVDGGGEPMPLPNKVLGELAGVAYAATGVEHRLDLTGQIKTCLQCGENLKPKTDHHRMGYKALPDHPRTIDDCQRLTNAPVIATHGYGPGRKERYGCIEWFETWDGETLLDPHFCNNACAAKYGRRAAQAEIVLEPGAEPEAVPYVPRDDRDHYEPETPQFATLEDGRIIRL